MSKITSEMIHKPIYYTRDMDGKYHAVAHELECKGLEDGTYLVHVLAGAFTIWEKKNDFTVK